MDHLSMKAEFDLGNVWFGSREKAKADDFSDVLTRNGVPVVRRLTINGYQVAVAPVARLETPSLVDKDNEKPK